MQMWSLQGLTLANLQGVGKYADVQGYNFVRELCKKCECAYYSSTGKIFRDSNIE